MEVWGVPHSGHDRVMYRVLLWLEIVQKQKDLQTTVCCKSLQGKHIPELEWLEL